MIEPPKEKRTRISMRTRTILALAALFLLQTAASAGWWDDVFEQKTVSLSTVLRNPNAFRGLDVAFVVQFHQVGEIDNPFYTKFEKDYYLNFSVWADEAPIWQRPAYDADFPFMFIDRIAPEHAEVVKAKTYDRFVIVGRVAEVFNGRPWIEVKGLKKLEGALNEPTLTHMVKAFTFKEYRKYGVAAQEFARAAHPALPPAVQFTILKNHASCLAQTEQRGEALAVIDQALEMNPTDEELVAMRAQCQEMPPSAEPARPGAILTAGRHDTPPAGDQRTVWTKRGTRETIRTRKTPPAPGSADASAPFVTEGASPESMPSGPAMPPSQTNTGNNN
jgi:hypothetical protein